MRIGLATLILVAAASAQAADVDVVGLFPGKAAVVAVDGAAPRSIAIGESVAGQKLVAVDGNGATFLVDGHRQTIAMGSYLSHAGAADRAKAVVGADARGQFMADGAVNGTGIRFLVDTGATLVMLSSTDATRLGVPYRQAPVSVTATANGTVQYRMVKLDRIKVGNVELTNVDAGVLDDYNGPALLGMSFLSRTEVSRDGAYMVLTRRF
jgi:aspartyl protease family protein